MTQENVIELSDIFKDFRVLERNGGALRSFFRPRYRLVQALRHLDLHAGPGEILGHIGPNGAGKSTTIKILAGVMSPTRGAVRVAGLDPLRRRVEHQRNLGIVIGQRPRLVWDLPVIESFHYHGLIYRVERAVLKQRTADMVERFALEEFITQPVRQLSLGQRMRCDLAMNLLHQPRVLLLDEPTIGLDVTAKKAFREVVRAAAREFGTTVLFTSHDLSDVEALSDRLVIMHRGEKIFDGTIAGLRQHLTVPSLLRLKSDAPPSVIAAVLADLPGVLGVESEVVEGDEEEAEELQTLVRFDPQRSSAASLLRRLLAQPEIAIIDFALQEPPIEDIVSAIYERNGVHAVPA
ncbi:MAG: ATP-binding cassette domain-containing protein [Truepera sp.]|nr:ATP-binding cassette domain-containing protein [Truepera sp.]